MSDLLVNNDIRKRLQFCIWILERRCIWLFTLFLYLKRISFSFIFCSRCFSKMILGEAIRRILFKVFRLWRTSGIEDCFHSVCTKDRSWFASLIEPTVCNSIRTKYLTRTGHLGCTIVTVLHRVGPENWPIVRWGLWILEHRCFFIKLILVWILARAKRSWVFLYH